MDQITYNVIHDFFSDRAIDWVHLYMPKDSFAMLMESLVRFATDAPAQYPKILKLNSCGRKECND